MADCPKHPIRKRYATCETCRTPHAEAAAPKPTGERTTADGLQWLDLAGQPPKLDARGRLLESFTFVRNPAQGVAETWGVGCRLPETPAVFAAFCAEQEARRARTHKAAPR